MINLDGEWHNELGSILTIKVEGSTIKGIYQTKVGDANGIYTLVGQADTAHDSSIAIGWVVVWKNEHGNSDSVTAWSGQCQLIDGTKTIVTTWLLTEETSPKDDWRSTIIGKDIFTMNKLTPEEINKNLKRGVKSSFSKKLSN